MKFAQSAWLWCLLVLPMLFAWIVFENGRRKSRFSRFANEAMWKFIAPEIDWAARVRKAVVWTLALGLVILSLARPQWGSHEESIKATGLDIIIALDVSNSMETEDVVPNRLKKAKHFIRSVVEGSRGDRIGVVGFAASSYVASPLTTDLDYVMETVDVLGPKMVANQGTDLGIGLETANRALDRGAEEAGHQDSNAPASRVILVVTDGEDFEGQAASAAKKLREAGTRVYVFGVGTEKGGPIPVRDENGQLHGYKRDRSGSAIVSAFQPTTLKQIADAAGGKYWTLSANETESDELLSELRSLARGEFEERKYLVYEERFQYPLALAVLLFLLELSLPARRMTSQLRHPASALALIAGLGLLSLMVFSSPARAEPLFSKQPPLDVYLKNKKGVEAFKGGNLEEAQKNFGAAQAEDPSLAELQYNQGLVQLQQGDVESAIQGFSGAAQGAEKSGDLHLKGESLYNLGAAYGKKGAVDPAIRSYLGAIDAAQRSKNTALENDARKNLQLLIQEQQKQKQKQQQQSQDSKDSKDDSQKDQEKKEEQQQQQQQQSNSQSGKGPDQKQDSGKDQGQDQATFQHIGILSLEFHVDKLSRPLL